LPVVVVPEGRLPHLSMQAEAVVRVVIARQCRENHLEVALPQKHSLLFRLELFLM
jgi:hypothetical protein